MKLAVKISLLIAFMGVVTLIVAVWFFSQILPNVAPFRSLPSSTEQALKKAQDRSLKKLNHKREELRNEIGDLFDKMESERQRMREEEEIFNKNFLERQNQLFDDIDAFREK